MPVATAAKKRSADAQRWCGGRRARFSDNRRPGVRSAVGGRARVRVGLRSCSGGSVGRRPHGFRTCSRRLRGAALRGAVFSVRCGAQPFAVQGVRYVHCRSGRCRRMTACNESPRSASGRHDAPFVFGQSAEAGPAGIALSPPDARCRPAMPTAGCRPLGGGRQSLRRMLFCCGCRSACGFARLRRTSKAAGRRMTRNHRSGARNVRPVPQGFSNGRTSILRGRLTARAGFCCGAGGASGRMTGASAGSAFSFLACRREAEILLLAPRASVRRSGLGSSE